MKHRNKKSNETTIRKTIYIVVIISVIIVLSILSFWYNGTLKKEYIIRELKCYNETVNVSQEYTIIEPRLSYATVGPGQVYYISPESSFLRSGKAVSFSNPKIIGAFESWDCSRTTVVGSVAETTAMTCAKNYTLDELSEYDLSDPWAIRAPSNTNKTITFIVSIENTIPAYRNILVNRTFCETNEVHELEYEKSCLDLTDRERRELSYGCVIERCIYGDCEICGYFKPSICMGKYTFNISNSEINEEWLYKNCKLSWGVDGETNEDIYVPYETFHGGKPGEEASKYKCLNKYLVEVKDEKN